VSPGVAATIAWNPELKENSPPDENPVAVCPTLALMREQELPAIFAPALSMA